MSSDLPPNNGRFHIRLRNIQDIIVSYQGKEPLHHFLSTYFKRNPSFGSRDRRIYRQWVYVWFRLGKAFASSSFNQRLLLGFYLVHGLEDDLAAYLNEEFKTSLKATADLPSRISAVQLVIGKSFLEDVFPFQSQLSSGIDSINFSISHFRQPDVFIRVRSGFAQKVAAEFSDSKIYFEKTDLENCWRIPAGTNLQTSTSWLKGLFEIQDYASQHVCSLIPVHDHEKWWDACSGAGGKTLYLADHHPSAKFVCSDIRPSILENFKLRAKRNHVKNVEALLLDAVQQIPSGQLFSGVIVDAPCSGSGTWTRNPENLVFFDESELKRLSDLQYSILQNAALAVQPNGFLVYITCSVFFVENEGVVKRFLENNGFELIVQQQISGKSIDTDSLFLAVLKKTS